MKRPECIRIAVACGIVAVIFTIFSARLVDLHITKHKEYSRLAANKHSMRQIIHANRGMILDRNGEILASNLPVRTVVADASLIKNSTALAALTFQFLGLKEEDVLKKISSDKKYIVLKRNVPEDIYVALDAAMRKSNLRGLSYEQDAIRIYPNGETLGHVLGFLDQDGKGVQGIELTMNSLLAGKNGYRFIERDRTGKEIMLYRGTEVEPVHGNNVRLSIDMNLQSILEDEIDKTFKEYKPETVTGIMLDPKTGEVLAMANRPCFNPNEPG